MNNAQNENIKKTKNIILQWLAPVTSDYPLQPC